MAHRTTKTPVNEDFFGHTTRRRTPRPTRRVHFRARRHAAIPEGEIFAGATSRRGPPHLPWTQFAQTYEQGFRVANDSLALYELYVGENVPPNFAAPPTATSATLPIVWSPTPPGAGTLTLHIVVRRRNKYDLQSFNVYETIRIIDTAGAEQLSTVSDPFDVAVYDDAPGYVRVLAKYGNTEDANPADLWEVYAAEGAAPTPGVSVPAYEGTMRFIGTEAGLQATIGPYTPGATLHVIVVAMRDVDNERGVAATVLKVLAEPLDLEEGTLFGNDAYEQR